jgi:hypothetical protein
LKAVQIPKPGAELQIVERDIPVPGAREVRIKVQACGVCHSDSFTKEGQWPGIQYPRVPGHEVGGLGHLGILGAFASSSTWAKLRPCPVVLGRRPEIGKWPMPASPRPPLRKRVGRRPVYQGPLRTAWIQSGAVRPEVPALQLES